MPVQRGKRRTEKESISKPSRSAKKRECLSIQKLGEEIAALAPARRADLDLGDDLREALEELDGINDHEAARRQKQYIGKLMRDMDISGLKEAMLRIRNAKAEDTRRMRQAEKWRSRLLDAPEDHLPEMLDELASLVKNRGASLEKLERAVLKAREKNAARAMAVQARRQLFRALVELLAE